MQLFYQPELDQTRQQCAFNKDESRHIVKVLRKKEGDDLLITNGKGLFFTSEIVIANSKQCLVKIVEVREATKLPINLHLAVAPTKMNDRYEWFLEKATEIGISEITPVICEHSERKIIKEERYEKVLQAAMKQSLQAYLPKLNPAIAFSEFIKQTFTGQKFIAHCEETAKESLKNLIQSGIDITILIGPEGDFSVKEIETALQQGFIPVTLGSTRLRTETAAIVACHSVVFINE